MNIKNQKELTPVKYDISGIKVLEPVSIAPHGLCFPLHWHERLEFLLVHENSLQLLLGEENITVSAGEIAIINPGQLHGGFAEAKGVSYSTIMFEPSSLLNETQASVTLLQPIIDHRIRFLHSSNNANVINIATSLIKNAKSHPSSSALITQGKAYELIGALYEDCLQPTATPVFNDDRFHSVLSFINLHFCENLTSSMLSRQFGYDESYFCRKFKSITGMTLTNYIRLLRLEKAQKLLRTKSIPIHQLSLSCGFPDVGYFCRCFKKQFGVSALQFQKETK